MAVDPATCTLQDCLSLLETRSEGLTGVEVEQRRIRFGANCLPEVAGPSLWGRLRSQFIHRMALLLWVAALLALLAELPQLALAIVAVNLLNGVFSFWQEYRARRATEVLKRLLPRWARVRREGRELRIAAEELVPGDILLLREGEHISADARLLWAVDFRVDLSLLTGESRPVPRSSLAGEPGRLPLEQPNRVFAGSTVVSGSARGVVLAVGGASEFGRIAHLTQHLPEPLSPLQQEMERLTHAVTALVLGIGLVFFGLSLGIAGLDPAQSFVFALGMIVAFVPEGLLPTVTLALAMGVRRMARRNALVKKLSAVETLGCTQVICTDKTGTLTKNQMTVQEVVLPQSAGLRITVSGVGYAPHGELQLEGRAPGEIAGLMELLLAGSLCNNARLLAPDQEADWSVLGDPTEGCLHTLALKAGQDPQKWAVEWVRVGEVPFDSSRKRMSTLHQRGDEVVLFVKGAPPEVLERCLFTLEGELGESQRQDVLQAHDRMARAGLRVLALALARPERLPQQLSGDFFEQQLTFLGLVGMHDPPRPEVAAAVAQCHEAGVRVLMITGDDGLTAESVARKIGILRSDHVRIVSGRELAALCDDSLSEMLRMPHELIFARMAPEQKLRVVKALQCLGLVVAVTGDGVNDAPALRQADIGVAMGVSGSDVAREAADMVLADDSFASIVAAIEEGRAVYANLRKFVSYIFTSNVPEAFPFVFFALSRGRIPLALNIMQVLAIDLGTDMLPALALGVEPPEEGVMKQPPRDRARPLVTPGLLARAYLYLGTIAGVAVMVSFFFAYWRHPQLMGRLSDLPAQGELYATASSMAFATVVLTQVGNLLAHRSEVDSLARQGLQGNPFLWLGLGFELLFLGALLYVPALQKVFSTAPLGLKDWMLILGWAPALLVADELRKALWSRRRKRAKS